MNVELLRDDKKKQKNSKFFFLYNNYQIAIKCLSLVRNEMFQVRLNVERISENLLFASHEQQQVVRVVKKAPSRSRFMKKKKRRLREKGRGL